MPRSPRFRARAQNAFEKDKIGPGLLRLVQSWRSAIAADDPGWQHAARAGLAAPVRGAEDGSLP